MMDRRWSILLLGATAAISAGDIAFAEAPPDYRCGLGKDVRRIEIRFENELGDLPCRVIYRPELESDTVGTVSWRGITALSACMAQANEIIDRLTAEGWTCAAQDDATTANDALPSRQVAQATQEQGVAVGDDDRRRDLDQRFAETEDRPAVLIDNPDIPPPAPDLAALIDQDLKRLDATLDGRLEAQIGKYGDLNADDVADALVLVTYVSPQPAYRQFLFAYLFDGKTYQLTATKSVSGSAQATRDAVILDVDQGIVHLSLRAFEPGDPSCCPSGTRQIALALRNLDLVPIEGAVLTR